MRVLGLSFGHDASVCLVEKGQVVYVLEAERFFNSKRFILDLSTAEYGERIKNYQIVNTEDFCILLDFFISKVGKIFDAVAIQNEGRKTELKIVKDILESREVKYKRIASFAHHFCHASAGFYSSDFSDAIVLSFDGMGNDGFTNFFYFSETSGGSYIKKYPIQLGRAYSNLGFLLGITPDHTGSTAGKTMGYTAYGNVRDEWVPFIANHIVTFQKKPWKKHLGVNSYGIGHNCNIDHIFNIEDLKQNFINVISGDRCKGNPQNLLIQNVKDFASTFQFTWSKIVVDLIKGIITNSQKTSKNLIISGGCALNGLTNYKIVDELNFDDYFFIPNPNDSGLAMGAALAMAHTGGTYHKKLVTPYLGFKVFDKPQSKSFGNIVKRYLTEDELVKIAAYVLHKNSIVAVLRGRSEIGPRALGNRSLLANPKFESNRKKINETIKKREWFRPLAPVVPEDQCSNYFKIPIPSPYMSIIGYTKPKFRKILAAVTHNDGSARVQTVTFDSNKFLYEVLCEFKKLESVSVLLNTSLNSAGEPILNTFNSAFKLLGSNCIDCLIVDDAIYYTRETKIEQVIEKNMESE